MEDNKFFVPVSLIVPGSQIHIVKNGDRDKANIDVIGQVKNAQGIIVGNVRDNVKLALDAAQQVQRKNIQYSTGFTLAPGKYHLKFVVRENQTGAMGSFETDLQVPDLKKSPLKLSSIVLSSQRVPNTAKKTVNPLVRDGVEWIPNVPHVFRQDQHLYFLYEVYDPAKQKGAPEPASSPGLTRREGGPVRVLTSIEFLSGGVKVYETPLVEANGDQYSRAGRGGVSVRCAADAVEAGDVCVPGKRDRRCGWKLQLSADGDDGAARGGPGGCSGGGWERRHRVANPLAVRPLTEAWPERMILGSSREVRP